MQENCTSLATVAALFPEPAPFTVIPGTVGGTIADGRPYGSLQIHVPVPGGVIQVLFVTSSMYLHHCLPVHAQPSSCCCMLCVARQQLPQYQKVLTPIWLAAVCLMDIVKATEYSGMHRL